VGEAVGFAVRLEQAASGATRCLYCTSGVLLRRLAWDPLLQGATHVFVDEVHER
jgi:HrpA-like RNA helicase